jgi:pyruvate/2-oxoglutarate dehydrogenase complex dihydrolipoamide dehydrogenase (E3) component
VHSLARHVAQWGTAADNVRLDWPAVLRRQREIVTAFQPSVPDLEKLGAHVTLGRACLLDAHTLEVDGARLAGKKILIAAGSEPVIPDVPGRELAITSDELLFLAAFPPSLTLVGAGAIGLEMASAFRDLGSEVTVVGRDPEILPGLDAEVAGYLRKILEAKGVAFRLSGRVARLDGRPGAITVRLEDGSEISSAVVCLAAGRRFHPRMLGGGGLGLETEGLGLKVTPYLRSSVPSIYAAGDAAGRRQLTPVAAHEGRIAALNALQGDSVNADEMVVPQVIFTTPEAASVGLSHREAEARGITCAVTCHDMRGASNGVASGEDGGYLKLVFERSTQRLLGAQMVSYAAAELIQLCTLAIRTGVPAKAVATQLSIHPSHGERLLKAFGADLREHCEP